jgi:hypothetical protein
MVFVVFVAPEFSPYSGGVDREQLPEASCRADRVQGCVLLDMASPEIGSLRFGEYIHRFPQQFDSAFQVLLSLGSVVGAGRGPFGPGLGEDARRMVESAGLVRTKY